MTTVLSHDTYLAALERSAARLTECARRVGPDADVPSCPGWRVGDLLAHLGGVHSWTRGIIAGNGPRTPRDEPSGELTQWYADQAGALVEALRAADPAAPSWSFGSDRSVGFWIRRQPHEVEMHRVDVELAGGNAVAYDVELAADGVSEVLDVMVPRRHADQPAAVGAPIRLVAADTGDWWLLLPSERTGVVDYRHGTGGSAPQEAAVTATASASDLVTGLWRRTPSDRWQIDGDRAVLDALLASGLTP
ncbi:maleylpyruvate isomerase family mycothiol-dependent enzyme [Cumulibacter manganitolerans]|uniref:maleylpyruvate isomerase family mycothiol-dependent enzyme n=1 Tax=Cumulibacter manganitolerans TaxID=1884992 RepID=UPI0012966284|nr:maleylpyruvate isomerase family mycothiol-dependent enzyme [Cumulibacter manganitolerans]